MTIGAINGDKILEYAKTARNDYQAAQENEDRMFQYYEAYLSNQIGKWVQNGTTIKKVNEDGSIEQVQVGDYVNYIPNTVELTGQSELIQLLQDYSGSTRNTADTIQQETLKWRVLDVVNGSLRLISEKRTNSKVAWGGYNGWNNAVYLLNKICETLYSGTSGVAKSLNQEDMELHAAFDYKKEYGQKGTLTAGAYYPKLLSELNHVTINGVKGMKYGKSEQTELMKQTEPMQAESNIIVMNDAWSTNTTLTPHPFTNDIYQQIFLDGAGGDGCWYATRHVPLSKEGTYTIGRLYSSTVGSGSITFGNVYGASSGHNYESSGMSFRPVVTLNAETKLTEKDENNIWQLTQ